SPVHRLCRYQCLRSLEHAPVRGHHAPAHISLWGFSALSELSRNRGSGIRTTIDKTIVRFLETSVDNPTIASVVSNTHIYGTAAHCRLLVSERGSWDAGVNGGASSASCPFSASI